MSRRRRGRGGKQTKDQTHRMGAPFRVIDTVSIIRKEQIEEGRRMMLAENKALKLGIINE